MIIILGKLSPSLPWPKRRTIGKNPWNDLNDEFVRIDLVYNNPAQT